MNCVLHSYSRAFHALHVGCMARHIKALHIVRAVLAFLSLSCNQTLVLFVYFDR